MKRHVDLSLSIGTLRLSVSSKNFNQKVNPTVLVYTQTNTLVYLTPVSSLSLSPYRPFFSPSLPSIFASPRSPWAPQPPRLNSTAATTSTRHRLIVLHPHPTICTCCHQQSLRASKQSDSTQGLKTLPVSASDIAKNGQLRCSQCLRSETSSFAFILLQECPGEAPGTQS